MNSECQMEEAWCERRAQIQEKLVVQLTRLQQYRVEVDFNAATQVSEMLATLAKIDGDKMGLMIPYTPFTDQVNPQAQKAFTKDFVKEIRKELISLYGSELASIWAVRDLTCLFLDAFREVFGRYITIGSSTYDWLRDIDVATIANHVTAAYAECWLENDRTSYQTPYGFVTHPYKKEDNAKRKEHNSPSNGEVSGIQRGYGKQVEYSDMRQRQARREGVKSTYHYKNKDKKAHPVDLITLTMSQAFCDGALEILDYLFAKKYIMDRAEDRRKGKTIGLSVACKSYQDYIQKIHDLDTGEKASIDTLRKYVAASIMLNKLEEANHFHLFAKIADKLCKQEIDPVNFHQAAWEVFFCRVDESKNQLFAPSWSKEHIMSDGKQDGKKPSKVYTHVNEPMTVMNQDFLIRHLFCCDGDEQTNVEIQVHQMRRLLLSDAMIFVSTFYPPEQQHPWQDYDFQAATVFYRESYPVTSELLQVRFPQLPNQEKRNHPSAQKLFYQHFRAAYEDLAMQPDSPLREGRKELQKLRKQHNGGGGI